MSATAGNPLSPRLTVRPKWSTVIGVPLIALLLTIVSAAPAAAHNQRRLSATILSNRVLCDELTYPYCAVEGKVRIRNNNPRGSGRIVICVGIDVHTKGHRSLSVEPPLPQGQATITLRPRKSGVTKYRTVFNASAGAAHHVHVTHVHKHVVHGAAGRQC
jgi:hypothetical protein